MRAFPRLAARAKAHVPFHLAFTIPATRRESRLVARAEIDELFARELADERLVAMVRHAYAKVPHYRATFAPGAVASLRGLDDLPLLAPLDRRAVQDSSRMLARGADPRSFFPCKTSGSTGEPVTVQKDVEAFHHDQAILGRLYRRFACGGRLHPLKTSFVSLLHTPKPRSQRQTTMGFSKAYRFGLGRPAWQEPIDVLRFLASLEGFILSASPSMLMELFRHSGEHDPERRYRMRPGLVLSSGGPLSEATRRTVAGFLDCPVVDAYITEEIGLVAVECHEGEGFHVEAPACVVECLREDGSPSPPGEEGEILLTGLRSRSMPLIRYRIGDTGSWTGEPCACGSSFPRLGRLIGRGGTVFRHRSGNEIAPASLGHALVGLPMTQHQIEQIAIDQFVVRYVLAPGAGRDGIEPPVRALFEQFFGSAVDLSMVETSQLGLPGEKVKPYINHLEDLGGE